MLLACKKYNAGKLDSHAWFFLGVCSKVVPRYVLQLDVGSVTEPDCIPHLLDCIRRSPCCGAVASHTTVPAPAGVDLVQNWQYGDYQWEKVSLWAIGNALHYLEVVPGQCSLIDYECFTALEGDGTSALSVYLRGLEPSGLLEHNLFLAEDRVLGFELVSRATGGSVHYAADARVRTDSACGFVELLRQRRRWINSTLAARWYSLLKLRGVMARCDIALSLRIGFFLSSGWGWLNMLTQLYSPAFSAWAMAVGFSYAFSDSQTLPDRLTAALAAGVFLGVWILVVFICRGVRLESRMGRYCHLVAICVLGLLLVATTLLIIRLADPRVLLLTGGGFAVIIFSMIVRSRDCLRHLLRLMVFCLLQLPVFGLYLTTYALANLCDTSWGTKGLTDSKVVEKHSRLWARQRDLFLAVWILCTCCIVMVSLLFLPVRLWVLALQVFAAGFFLRAVIASLAYLVSFVQSIRLR
ncbi:glycosyltransferase [Pseudomonas putida]